MATAFHEAGHAWGYFVSHKPLRYITIRARRGGGMPGNGSCQPWKPRRIDIGVAAWIAAAGPMAEAIWLQQSDTQDELDDIIFDDYLVGALFAGGREDLERSRGLLDSNTSVEFMREALLGDWSKITALAEGLVAERTLSGAKAFELLAG